MLTAGDDRGRMTGCQAVSYALALIPGGLLPATIGLAGPLYFRGALLLGLVYLRGRGTVLAGRQRPGRLPAAPYLVRLPARDPAPAAPQSPDVLTSAQGGRRGGRVPFVSPGGSRKRWLSPPPAQPTRSPRGTPAAMPPYPTTRPQSAREGGDVALPRHRGHVLHRADRVVHRPPRRQPAQRLQPFLSRRQPLQRLDNTMGLVHPVGRIERARGRASPPHRRGPQADEHRDDPPLRPHGAVRAARPRRPRHSNRSSVRPVPTSRSRRSRT